METVGLRVDEVLSTTRIFVDAPAKIAALADVYLTNRVAMNAYSTPRRKPKSSRR